MANEVENIDASADLDHPQLTNTYSGGPLSPELEALRERPIAQLFLDRCDDDADGVAVRVKERGIWREVTWGDLRDSVTGCMAGLQGAGLASGDLVAIMADPSVAWIELDLAIQLLGGIAYGIYPTVPPDILRQQLELGPARFYVAGDQEHLDKILALDGDPVERIIVVDTTGVRGSEDPRLVFYRDLLQSGADRPSNETLRQCAARRSPEEIVGLFFTSGTTGAPKAAALSSRNVLAAWTALFSVVPTPDSSDRTLVSMPMAHLAGRVLALYLPVAFGCVAHLPESPDESIMAAQEVRPTVAATVPRVWETLASRLQMGMETAGRINRAAHRLAMHLRRRDLAARWQGRVPGVLTRLGSWLAYRIVCHPALDKFGYRDARFVFSGGAPMGEDLVRFWQLWGVQVREMYGMTEVGLFAAGFLDGLPEPGCAGPPLPGVSIGVDSTGELFVRGPGNFSGYWQDADSTARTLHESGWLRTGDLGSFDSAGRLHVMDRRKDLIVTADGTEHSVAQYETALKTSPYIRDVMLIGEGRRELVALIELEFETVAEWARSCNISYATLPGLVREPSIATLISKAVESTNRALESRGLGGVANWRLFPKELDPEVGDEITATRKLMRPRLLEKFDYLVREMYEEMGEAL